MIKLKKFDKPIVAMLCVTALALAALFTGHDTYLFSMALFLIGGLGGYEIHHLIKP